MVPPRMHATPPSPPPASLGCLIEPTASAEIAAPVGGIVASVLVDRGDKVRRGQTLVRLQAEFDRASLDAAMQRANASAEIAANAATRDIALQKALRQHELMQMGFGSTAEYDTAKGELEVADHRLAAAQEAQEIARREASVARVRLEQRTIRSPIDGVVADRLLQPGERADGRPLLRILKLDTLRVEIVVPASRFGQMRTGQTLKVTPEGATEPLEAKIRQIDAFVDGASGTFRARLSLVNADGRVPAGVRCQVALD
jgi:cobalt-zinc-cadmium efflux system membrane fusion protein